MSLLQNYKNAVTPAEAGVQKPLNSLDSCFRRNDRKSNYDTHLLQEAQGKEKLADQLLQDEHYHWESSILAFCGPERKKAVE